MIRDTDTLNALLAETDEIPDRIVRGMKELARFGLTVPEE